MSSERAREVVLERRLTIDEIESESPYLRDSSLYNGSQDEWELMVKDWLHFATSYRDGDAVWKYRDIESNLGFVAGDGGYLIRRGDSTVAKFVTYVVG